MHPAATSCNSCGIRRAQRTSFLRRPHLTKTSILKREIYWNGLDTTSRRAPRAVGNADSQSNTPDNEDYGKMASQLNRLMSLPTINGKQLHELILKKWGRSYECRLHKKGNRIYFEVMWKFLEQVSFPLTKQQYMDQMDAVAEYLTDWGVVETVRQGVMAANPRGPGYTGGRAAKSIIVPLDVDLTGSRCSEWS